MGANLWCVSKIPTRLVAKKEYEDDMLDNLAWLGLTRDGELGHQSERSDVYKKYLHKLSRQWKGIHLY